MGWKLPTLRAGNYVRQVPARESCQTALSQICGLCPSLPRRTEAGKLDTPMLLAAAPSAGRRPGGASPGLGSSEHRQTDVTAQAQKGPFDSHLAAVGASVS